MTVTPTITNKEQLRKIVLETFPQDKAKYHLALRKWLTRQGKGCDATSRARIDDLTDYALGRITKEQLTDMVRDPSYTQNPRKRTPAKRVQTDYRYRARLVAGGSLEIQLHRPGPESYLTFRYVPLSTGGWRLASCSFRSVFPDEYRGVASLLERVSGGEVAVPVGPEELRLDGIVQEVLDPRSGDWVRVDELAPIGHKPYEAYLPGDPDRVLARVWAVSEDMALVDALAAVAEEGPKVLAEYRKAGLPVRCAVKEDTEPDRRTLEELVATNKAPGK